MLLFLNFTTDESQSIEKISLFLIKPHRVYAIFHLALILIVNLVIIM